MVNWFTNKWSDSGFRWSLFVFFSALLLRVVNLIFLSRNDPAFYVPQVDSLWHHRWAIEILTKNFWGDEIFFRAPLYPYFLALIYWIFGIKIFVAKFVQAIGGALTCVLIYQLGNAAFSERVGRLASLFATFYGTLILYESELLIEWLPIIFNLWMLLEIVRQRENHSHSRWAVIGILGGLSAIARPNVLLVFPLLFVWLWWDTRRELGWLRSLKRPAALLFGVVLCLLPVTVRNYFVGHDLILVSVQGGINFYLGNNPEADGLTMQMPEIKLDLSIPWSDFVDTTDAYAQAAAGELLKPSEISNFWKRRAWEWVFSHPLDFAALTAKRCLYLFSGFENSDQADIYRFSENSPILQTLIFDRGIKFPFGVIAPLALLGLVLAWSQRQRLAPVYLLLLGYIPTIILFLVTARHRLAVIVLFLIFAAFAVERLWQWSRERQAAKLVAACAVLALLLVGLNLRPFELGFDTSWQYHYQRGQVLEKQGLLDEAINEYRASVSFLPSAEALNNLGYALSRRNDFAGAYRAYQQALQVKPGGADVLANLGLLFLNVNELDSAAHYLNSSQQRNPNLPQVYVNLAELHERREDPAAAEQALRNGIAVAPGYGPLYNGLASLLLKQARRAEAVAVLHDATGRVPGYAIAHANLANLAQEDGDLVTASRHYHDALQISPELSQARFNLAALFLQQNFPDSARMQLERILTHDPNYVPARQMLQRLDTQR